MVQDSKTSYNCARCMDVFHCRRHFYTESPSDPCELIQTGPDTYNSYFHAGVPRGSAQAGRQSDGEIFGNPVSEHGRVVRDNAEGNQAFRRGKRSRPRGNFRRGARPHPGSKHPRFVDFDAPHGPQVL